MPPITPKEVLDARKNAIPEFVFEAFNLEIAKKMDETGVARVLQDDVVRRLVEDAGVDRNRIFLEHWLDVEEIYEKAGWNVVFERNQAWAGEYGPDNWTFTAKKGAK